MIKEGLYKKDMDITKFFDIKKEHLEGINVNEIIIEKELESLEKEGFFELGLEFDPDDKSHEVEIPVGLNLENLIAQSNNQSLDEINLKEISLEEYKVRLKAETSWSDEIIDSISSIEEGEIYREAKLKEEIVNGRACLVKEDLDLDTPVDPLNRTNRERMELGLSPIDEKGEKIELHHMGQKSDGPLVELSQSEHRGKGSDGVLHDKTKVSEIDRNEFNNEKSEHWNARAEGV